MTMTQPRTDLVQENEYIDVQEWLAELDRQVTDDDMTTVPEQLKINLRMGAIQYVSTYRGNSSFVKKLRAASVKSRGLTDRQLRAALNVLRDELKKGEVTIASREGRGKQAATATTAGETHDGDTVTVLSADYKDHNYTVECYDCHRWFKSVSDVIRHKPECHIWAPVITDEGTTLDISDIKDGNYAIMKSDRSFLFVQVRTQKRTVKRDRKYRYGKIKSGKEVVLAGTIEVRIQRGDTKELVGEQRPGEGYRGSYVDELLVIRETPELWATFYATQMKCCYICGKSLTDDVSMSDLIGPDCWQRWGSTYFQQWSRKKAVEEAAATVDTDEEDHD